MCVEVDCSFSVEVGGAPEGLFGAGEGEHGEGDGDGEVDSDLAAFGFVDEFAGVVA